MLFIGESLRSEYALTLEGGICGGGPGGSEEGSEGA